MAGLFDGEGSVSIADRPRARVGARIGEYAKHPQYMVWPRITNTSEMLMKSIYHEFGGGLYLHQRISVKNRMRKPAYEWAPKNATDSIIILNGMLPFLRYKKPEARLGVMFLRRVKPNNRGMKLPQEEYMARQKIVDQMKVLEGRRVCFGKRKTGWR